MEVARTSMIHAVAPHFLWPFAVRYAAHELNLWPRVSLPETSPTLRWTGEVGDASLFRVWGSRAFVRDTSADKLSPRAIPCVFLGFVPDALGWQFYHPASRRVFPSEDVTFEESVPIYRLFPYRSAPPPPPPLFLAPGSARGAGAAGAGGAGVVAGAGVTGATATTSPGGARTRESGAAGAGGSGAGGTGAGGAGVGGTGVGGAGVGGPSARGAGAVDPVVATVTASLSTACSFYLHWKPGGLTERHEPASRLVSPVRTARHVPGSRPPPVPGTHAMTLRPSSVPLRVPLRAPPESSLREVPDPESDRALAVCSTVSRLVAESASPPFVGGECALGTDVLEDRQEDFECLAAVVPRFASMLLAPEGDPGPPYIPTPRSYAEAITGPCSSQWQAAMDAEMAA
ncbi:unnamed protein product [Closterium sp. NIES-53]